MRTGYQRKPLDLWADEGSDGTLHEKMLKALADGLLETEETIAAQENISNPFAKYQEDPEGFVREVLNESYPPEIGAMFQSFRDNPTTVAISANGVGKTWAAARCVIWAFKCFSQSQVYTFAAPPEDNLKRILWGQIGMLVMKHPHLFREDRVTSMNIDSGSSPNSFITGVAIPQVGDEKQMEARFCASADDLIELSTGELVPYSSLIGTQQSVMSVDGQLNKSWAVAEFFDNGVRPVYEIVTQSGAKIRRTGNHPLLVGTYKTANTQSTRPKGCTLGKRHGYVSSRSWRSVDSLAAGDVVLVPKDTSFNEGSEEMDVDELKVLAYLIGDGSLSQLGTHSSIMFAQQDNAQLQEFRECIERLGCRLRQNDVYNWRVAGAGKSGTGSNQVLNLCRRMGMMGKGAFEKSVPSSVNKLSNGQLAIFLSRLFSTDGWASIGKCGVSNTRAEIGYESVSEVLVRDIQRLLLRFGIQSKVRQHSTSWTWKGVKKTGLSWRCSFQTATDILKFEEQIGIYGKEQAVQRCVDRAKEAKGYAQWRQEGEFFWDTIKSVTYIGEYPTVGVYVPVNHTYLTNFVEHNSGKHSPHLFFVGDEADAVPEPVYSGIESCMSGGHARLLLMFNPRKPVGPVYLRIQNNQANVVHLSALTHPNVVTGQDIYPGAVTQNTTVRRINEWTRPLYFAENPYNDEGELNRDFFEVPKHLVGVQAIGQSGELFPPLHAGIRKVVIAEFFYMVLGRYPSAAINQLFVQEDIDRARARWDLYVAEHGEVAPEGAEGVAGLDCAEFGPDFNVFTPRWGGFVGRPITWQGVKTDVSITKAVAALTEHKITTIDVDANGIGAGIWSGLIEQDKQERLKVERVMMSASAVQRDVSIGQDKIAECDRIRDELFWRAREWLRTDQGAMLPPIPELLMDLSQCTYVIDNGRLRVTPKRVMRDILKRSCDWVDSLVLTFYKDQTEAVADLYQFNYVKKVPRSKSRRTSREGEI